MSKKPRDDNMPDNLESIEVTYPSTLPPQEIHTPYTCQDGYLVLEIPAIHKISDEDEATDFKKVREIYRQFLPK